jgi:hypothetical protein
MKENNWVIDLNDSMLMYQCKKWYTGHMGRSEVRLVDCAWFYNLNDAVEYIRFKDPGSVIIITEAAREYNKSDSDKDS